MERERHLWKLARSVRDLADHIDVIASTGGVPEDAPCSITIIAAHLLTAAFDEGEARGKAMADDELRTVQAELTKAREEASGQEKLL